MHAHIHATMHMCMCGHHGGIAGGGVDMCVYMEHTMLCMRLPVTVCMLHACVCACVRERVCMRACECKCVCLHDVRVGFCVVCACLCLYACVCALEFKCQCVRVYKYRRRTRRSVENFW